MKKNLRKNKKGFTLVEIIVVLLIIGILLAITIPSIMGYVGKAKDAQIEAQARAGYVAAQTITAKEVAKDSALTKEDLEKKIKANAITTELDETTGSISKAGCVFNADKSIKTCALLTTASDKYVIFTAQDGTKGADTEVTKTLPADFNGVGDYPKGA